MTEPVTAPRSNAPVSAPASSEVRERDWTDQVTDLIVDTVDQVRAKTTGPVLGGARALVFVVMATLLLIPVVILGFAGLIRLLDWAIPGGVWIVYLLLGGVLFLGGLFVFSRRESR